MNFSWGNSDKAVATNIVVVVVAVVAVVIVVVTA